MSLIKKALSEDLTVYSPSNLKKEHGIVFCFTNRYGGYSKGRFKSLNVDYYTGDSKTNVKKNRKKILEKLNLENLEFIYSARQIHGNSILNINKYNNYIKLDTDNIPVECDCIVTDLKNTPIMVMGADCNLILIADIEKKTVAAVHAGWKGTLKEITAKTILYMRKEFKSKTENIVVAFGPGIRRCCYKVTSVILEEFTGRFGCGNFFSIKGDNIFLDLIDINLMQLHEAGISKENIYDCGLCTCCNHDFYSYRRSKITGRQAAVAVIL
ncbi:MAG: peptidoglycan editing factor PgeF [Candidatus Humimicrobiaceae bacterium]|jgi:YfiH family protein|nr:peptidoglycan editing factor PgeF [Actinomycetota bacterium]MDY0027641.1 peptidoglycan editing factor PgeF [Candidatus Humimicrobiaceae bacterium]